MTTKTKTIVVKTPGQVFFEQQKQELGKWAFPGEWIGLCEKSRQCYERFAVKHNFQPLTKEVPDKPTDGELLANAKGLVWVALNEATRSSLEAEADKFLRLVRERDGDPLEVTAEMLSSCWNPGQSWGEFADKLNAKLAEASKPANKPEPLKVAAFATRNGVLHTFESLDDFTKFREAWGGDCNMLGRPDRWVHHAELAKAKDV